LPKYIRTMAKIDILYSQMGFSLLFSRFFLCVVKTVAQSWVPRVRTRLFRYNSTIDTALLLPDPR